MALVMNFFLRFAKGNRTNVRKRNIKKQKIQTESYKTKKQLQNEYDSFIEPNNKFSNELELYNNNEKYSKP